MLQSASGVLCAELVKEFLEFYRLDYTLAIYMPEVNLNQHGAMSRDELSRKVGLGEASAQKPLMAQLIEGFLSNAAPAPSLNPQKKEDDSKFSFQSKSNDKVELFAEPEKKKADTSSISQMSGGHSFSGQSKPKNEEKSTTDKHLEKANQMLEEQKREEKSGYQFGGRYGS